MGILRQCIRPDCKAEFEAIRKNQVHHSPICKKEMERRQRLGGKATKEIYLTGKLSKGIIAEINGGQNDNSMG